MKAIFEDGKVYRIRRGQKVEVPPEWVGCIPTDLTKHKRQSRMIQKRKRDYKNERTGGALKFKQL